MTRMNRAVWGLLSMAIVSWGICGAYPNSDIHFGWLGTLFGSAAALLATASSYLTEEKVHTRGGGVIYKSESPTKFLVAYLLVGLFLAALAVVSILGCMGRLVQ
jgi:hypothetical protein